MTGLLLVDERGRIANFFMEDFMKLTAFIVDNKKEMNTIHNV